jgi:hypothetical protein
MDSAVVVDLGLDFSVMQILQSSGLDSTLPPTHHTLPVERLLRKESQHLAH